MKRPPPKPPSRRPLGVAVRASALLSPLDPAITSLPRVAAPSLEGLRVQVQSPPSVTAEELIARLQQRLRAWAPRRQRTQDETIQAGDEVVCDLIASLDGQVLAGSARRRLPVTLSPGEEHLPGLAEALLGKNSGAGFSVCLRLAQEDPAAPAADREADIQIQIHQVFEVSMPELDDLQALEKAELGSSLDQAMEILAQEIDLEQGEELLRRAGEAVLEQLSLRVQASIPEAIVEEELRRRWEESERPLLQERNLPPEKQGQALQNFLDNPGLRADAFRRIRVSLALAAIAQKEGLSPDPEILQELLQLASEEAQLQRDEVKQALASHSPEAFRVAQTALHLTVFEFVMARAHIEVLD